MEAPGSIIWKASLGLKTVLRKIKNWSGLLGHKWSAVRLLSSTVVWFLTSLSRSTVLTSYNELENGAVILIWPWARAMLHCWSIDQLRWWRPLPVTIRGLLSEHAHWVVVMQDNTQINKYIIYIVHCFRFPMYSGLTQARPKLWCNLCRHNAKIQSL